jgi:hypothetical protein
MIGGGREQDTGIGIERDHCHSTALCKASDDRVG